MRYSIAATFAAFVIVFAAIPEARSAPLSKAPVVAQIRRNGMFPNVVSTLSGHVVKDLIALGKRKA